MKQRVTGFTKKKMGLMNEASSTATESTKCKAPGFVLLSSSILQNPLIRRNFGVSPKMNMNMNMNVIDEVHRSITSTADKCLRFLHSFVSQNPILNKILSFSPQIECRKYKNNVKSLSNHNFGAILPGDSVAGIVVTNGILNFLSIYNTLLIVRLVLTWFPNTPPAIVSPLSTLCDPYLNIFRGIIPPLGGTLDLSPILAFLVLNAFTSTAAALPAELPPTGPSQGSSNFTHLTSSQKKWMTRLSGNRPKSSSGVN